MNNRLKYFCYCCDVQLTEQFNQVYLEEHYWSRRNVRHTFFIIMFLLLGSNPINIFLIFVVSSLKAIYILFTLNNNGHFLYSILFLKSSQVAEKVCHSRSRCSFVVYCFVQIRYILKGNENATFFQAFKNTFISGTKYDWSSEIVQFVFLGPNTTNYV